MWKPLKFVWIFFLFLVVLLFFVRLLSPLELDDVSPEIPCEEKLIEKSDVLWVIPSFNEKPISENKEWCSYILSFNKTIGMHGVEHSYYEFNIIRKQDYIDKGIKEFEACFGVKPSMFKPPHLKINKENKNIISKNNFVLRGKLNQLIAKVYHCNDIGTFPNWINEIV